MTNNIPVANMANIFDQAWRKATLEAIQVKTHTKRMNPEACARMAIAVMEQAPVSEFTMKVLGIDPSWQKVMSLPHGQFSRLMVAAIVGGAVPAWFEEAAQNGGLVKVGKGDLDPRLPITAIEAGLVKLETCIPGCLKGKKGIIFPMFMKWEDKQDWLKEAERSGVRVVDVKSLFDELYGSFEFELKHIGALARIHAPVEEGDTLVISRRYEALRLRIAHSETHEGIIEFFFNGEKLKYNTFVCGKADGVLDLKVNAYRTAFLALAHILSGRENGNKVMAGRIAFLTEAFAEKESGAHRGDRMMAVSDGKVGVLTFAPTRNMGFFIRNGESSELLAAQSAYWNLGLAVFAHHQFDWITVGEGAEAKGAGAGVDFDKDGNMIRVLRTFMKPDKFTKILNRLALAKPTARIREMARSLFNVVLSSGRKVALDGKLMDVMYANCALLSNGSGNAISNGFKVKVFGDKTFHVEVALGIDTKIETAEAMHKKFLKVPEKGTFGDDLITWNGAVRQKFMQFGSDFTRKKVTGYWDSVRKVYCVDVVVEWTYETTTEKFVLDGHKFRTTPDKLLIAVQQADGSWVQIAQPDAFLDGETLKGPQGLVCWWAQAKGGVDYDPKTGLTADQQGEFEAWKVENTKTMSIRRRVNSILYSNLETLYGLKGSEPDAAYVFHGNNYVTWTGPVITGSVVAAVEYSTTYQAVGSSALFPELLHSMSLLTRNYADYLWNGKVARHNRAALQGLVKMALHTKDNPKNRDAAAFIELDSGDRMLDVLSSASAGEIMKELVAKYPDGAILVYADKEVLVDFDALYTLGFNEKSGAMSGPGQHVVDLVRYFLLDEDDRPGNEQTYVESLINMIKGAVGNMLSAKGILNKAVRSGRLLTRKVSTVSRYGVEAWELHVNPADPAVLKGDLKPGMTVGACRVPMVFWGCFTVVLDVQTPIGVFELDPYCWAACNEGDSDGDGIAVLPIPEKVSYKKGKNAQATEIFPANEFRAACKVSRLSSWGLEIEGTDKSFAFDTDNFFDAYFTRKFEANKVSALTGGYAVVYGSDPTNHPFFEFLAQKPEKDADKITTVNGKAFQANVEPGSVYLDLCESVEKHYSRFVGQSYGVATTVLHLTSVLKDRNWADDHANCSNLLVPVLLLLQRFFHEGKHLGGFTPLVTTFWDKFDTLVSEGEVEIDGTTYQGAAGALELINKYLEIEKSAGVDGLRFNEDMAKLFVDARKIARCGGAAERGGDMPEFGTEEVFGGLIEDWGKNEKFSRNYSNGTIVRLGLGETAAEAKAVQESFTLADQLESDEFVDLFGASGLMLDISKAAYSLHAGAVAVHRKLYADKQEALEKNKG